MTRDGPAVAMPTPQCAVPVNYVNHVAPIPVAPHEVEKRQWQSLCRL